ncbi:hypothetical protein Tco_0506531 [Tanacetum coccineum]
MHIPAPLSPSHIFEFPNGNSDEEEEPEEEELEEMDMDMDIEMDSDNEMNYLELIFLYEAVGSTNPLQPESDTSSDFKPEDDTATIVGTITQMPTTMRRFPGSTFVMGEPSFDAPVAYHPEDLVLSTMRRECNSLHGVVKTNSDVVEYGVTTLVDRVLELENDGVQGENTILMKELKSAELSVTLARMEKDRIERELYELRL